MSCETQKLVKSAFVPSAHYNKQLYTKYPFDTALVTNIPKVNIKRKKLPIVRAKQRHGT